jgi:hypothetical protein
MRKHEEVKNLEDRGCQRSTKSSVCLLFTIVIVGSVGKTEESDVGSDASQPRLWQPYPM